MSRLIDIALLVGGLLAAAAVAGVGLLGLVVWLGGGRRTDASEAWPRRPER